MPRRSGAATLRVREHGTAGPIAFVPHGGPVAPGSAGPLARGLSDAFRVFEPFQRGSGAEPLTVARHVADLHAMMSALRGDERPVIDGLTYCELARCGQCPWRERHARDTFFAILRDWLLRQLRL